MHQNVMLNSTNDQTNVSSAESLRITAVQTTEHFNSNTHPVPA
jgi:hypothetical protein